MCCYIFLFYPVAYLRQTLLLLDHFKSEYFSPVQYNLIHLKKSQIQFWTHFFSLKSELRLMDPDCRNGRPALSLQVLQNSGLD